MIMKKIISYTEYFYNPFTAKTYSHSKNESDKKNFNHTSKHTFIFW